MSKFHCGYSRNPEDKKLNSVHVVKNLRYINISMCVCISIYIYKKNIQYRKRQQDNLISLNELVNLCSVLSYL